MGLPLSVVFPNIVCVFYPIFLFYSVGPFAGSDTEATLDGQYIAGVGQMNTQYWWTEVSRRGAGLCACISTNCGKPATAALLFGELSWWFCT